MNLLLSGSLASFLQLLGVLIIFLFVLAVTYLATRWMGAFQRGRGANRNLRIVESIGVGSNKVICIVAAGKRYLVVASCKDEVRLLAELTEDELCDLSFLEEPQRAVSPESFAELLEKIKERLPVRRD